MKLQDLVKLKPIIEAIEQGKTIQFCTRFYNLYTKTTESVWQDMDNVHESDIPALITHNIYYRIKLEPREWYIRADDIDSVSPTAYKSTFNGLGFIKVREVLE